MSGKCDTLHEFTQSDLQQNCDECVVIVDQTKMAFIDAKRQRLEENNFSKENVNVASIDENISYTTTENLTVNTNFGRRKKCKSQFASSIHFGTKSGRKLIF